MSVACKTVSCVALFFLTLLGSELQATTPTESVPMPASVANKVKAKTSDEELAAIARLFDSGEFPDGCGKAAPEVDKFVDFYDLAITHLAANKGARSKGVAELFAVVEMRSFFSHLKASAIDDSAIDRLITAQLCQFKKYRTRQLKPGATALKQINASDTELHEHLVGISTKLYRDTRSIVSAYIDIKNRERMKLESLKSKTLAIRQAKELAKEKVSDLIIEGMGSEE